MALYSSTEEDQTMADQQHQPPGGPEGLSEDPIVERLVPDPSQPPTPPPVALVGLLGRSLREGYWRLYFSSQLERYAEFKEEDVLNSVKIPQEQPPFAGLEATKVWLRRDAEVEYTRTESRRVQAEFLQGSLAAGFGGAGGGLGAAQMLGGGGGGPWGATRLPWCGSAVDMCPSALVPGPCPPRQTFDGCTVGGCASMLVIECGSMVDACLTRVACQSVLECEVGV